MTNKDKIHSGEVYLCNDKDILKEQELYLDKLYDFNITRPTQRAKRREMLKDMFASIGENCHIEPPFHANWGGRNVHFGNNVYANFNLTLVDDTYIYVGDNVLFAPNVTVVTGTHPIEPSIRIKGGQFNKPVKIGNNVWIGTGSVIMPGVSIGDNSIIGAGSIVTKDIPANMLAYGSPCKVIRDITEKDN